MKQDFDLIPKKESGKTFAGTVLPIVMILLLFAALLYLGIIIPQNRYHEVESMSISLEKKITEKANAEKDYNEALELLNTLKEENATVQDTKVTQNDALNTLYIIQEACPVSIRISHAELSNESITLVGYAPNEKVIAQFMVELKNTGVFGLTNISKIEPSDTTFSDEFISYFNDEDISQSKMFTLYLSYPVVIDESNEEGT